jgi:hypothetical protein
MGHPMEYRGQSYRVVQGLEGAWKWSVEVNGRSWSGVTRGSRQAAVRLVESEIDRALVPKKKKVKAVAPARGESGGGAPL